MSASSTHASKTKIYGRVAAVLAGALLLTASIPAAEAATGIPPMGMSVGDIAALKAAGATPRYGSFWVGEWMMSSGWSGFDNAMSTAKAAGVTPVVYWYYWGDSISPSCVQNGCSSKTRSEWTAMTSTLASHLRSTLGGAEVLIVLENEFNKNGITDSWYAPTFDAHLEAVAKTLKGVSGAKLVLGLGGWGEQQWTSFPRSAAQSDYIGFQAMRASTRDSESSYRAVADKSAYFTNLIAQKFNKPSFLYDLALSSYPDARWATLQAQTLDAIFAKLVSSGSTGLQGVVYRELKDHYMDPKNYFGNAESHWGLRTSSNAAKPAFDVWLKYAKGTAPAPAPSPAPSPTPTPPGAFSPTFSGVKGNEWWVQASVSASEPLAGVCATVNGGACQALSLRSYGWAASFRVPAGSTVAFRATSQDGDTATSGGYRWPDAAPVSAAPTPAPTGTATFAPHDGNAWWVQAKVSSPQGVKSVCATVNGGGCQALSYKSWGSWAGSFNAPTGSKVVFRATLNNGAVVSSATYTWPVG
jgi:hypothetical protein